MKYTFDPRAVCEFIDLTMDEGQVFELRVPQCKLHGQYKVGTYSGNFDRDHCAELVAALQQIEWAPGVYVTPNPLNPALHSRSYNRARLVDTKQATTSDADILRRKWLLIDVDVKRPTGISSNEAEKRHASQLITDLDYWLWERGFPPGLIGDSGNGSHLMIPVDLPAADGGFCQRLLKTLAREFDNQHAAVDTTTANASRIWKLPGTLACKGDHAPQIGRPWRMARIVMNCLEVGR